IARCRGVLSDGLVFELPGCDEPPPSRAIAGHLRPNDDSLDVYLAIPEHRPDGKAVTHVAAAQADEPPPLPNTRYIAQNRGVVDENTGTEEKIVQVARKNFRLLFGDEVLDGMATLRVGRIIRDQAGKYILDPEFIAPCLDIESSEYLMGLAKRQIELLRNKSA